MDGNMDGENKQLSQLISGELYLLISAQLERSWKQSGNVYIVQVCTPFSMVAIIIFRHLQYNE